MPPKFALLVLCLLGAVSSISAVETTTKPCSELEKECEELCMKDQQYNCDHCKGICNDYYNDYGVIHG